MSNVHHVLVTGAAGHIGQVFRRAYGDRYRLRLTDRQEPIPASPEQETVIADLTDFDAVRAAMTGVDAVVHLAADARGGAPWSSVLPNNIEATHNVFRAARKAGVSKVVFASSHHACGHTIGAEGRCGHPGQEPAPVSPDSLYAVSKVFGEALGRHYSDRFGLSVICLRIGWCHGIDSPEHRRAQVRLMQVSRPGLPYSGREQVALWISNPDMAQLIHCSLQAAVPFGIYYGTSHNEPVVLDITRAKTELGYRPQDSVNDYL
jgi:nucleoside-diphosphate-sugar epimerase